MQKYYVKNVGNYGFTGAYNIDKVTQNLQIVYLDDLYKALGNGDGEDVTIYLAKFMAPYEGAIKDKYPKATIENNEKFDAHTKLHDWFPGAQPLKDILKRIVIGSTVSQAIKKKEVFYEIAYPCMTQL